MRSILSRSRDRLQLELLLLRVREHHDVSTAADREIGCNENNINLQQFTTVVFQSSADPEIGSTQCIIDRTELDQPQPIQRSAATVHIVPLYLLCHEICPRKPNQSWRTAPPVQKDTKENV